MVSNTNTVVDVIVEQTHGEEQMKTIEEAKKTSCKMRELITVIAAHNGGKTTADDLVCEADRCAWWVWNMSGRCETADQCIAPGVGCEDCPQATIPKEGQCGLGR